MNDIISDIAAGRMPLPGNTEAERYPTAGGLETWWKGTSSSEIGDIDCCGPQMRGTRQQAKQHAQTCRR